MICRVFGHKGKWWPWSKTWRCRWCHEEVIPLYR